MDVALRAGTVDKYGGYMIELDEVMAGTEIIEAEQSLRAAARDWEAKGIKGSNAATAPRTTLPRSRYRMEANRNHTTRPCEQRTFISCRGVA